jgi:type I restriction enzyme R subunit
MVDGKHQPVTVEEYKAILAAKLVAEVPTLEEFRKHWIVPVERRDLMGHLPDAGRSAVLVQKLERMDAFDLYDVLGEVGYGLDPKTRAERAEAFNYKHEQWLKSLPPASAATLKAMAEQFAVAGTEGLENPEIFKTPQVMAEGGLSALQKMGRPADVLLETKARMFAA